MNFLRSIFCFISTLAFSLGTEYEILDGLASSTDKGSGIHNYTEAYAEFFAPLREQPIRFLEIGIGGGGSALLWDRYFPHAEIHMIDNNPVVYGFKLPERIHIHIVDQADREALVDFAEEVDALFDVIIDDGGHTMEQQIASLETLFPYVKPGGIYIIEDLATSYWLAFGGYGMPGAPQSGGGTTIDYLKNLVEDLNYTCGLDGYADWKRTPRHQASFTNPFQSSLHSIHFYKGICFIRKLRLL